MHADVQTLQVVEDDALAPELDPLLENDLVDQVVGRRNRIGRIAVGHERLQQRLAGGGVVVRRSLGLDQVHLLDTHHRDARHVTRGIVSFFAVGRVELKRCVGGYRCELLLGQGRIGCDGVERAVGSDKALFAEVARRNAVVAEYRDTRLRSVAVTPDSLGRHVGRPRQQVVEHGVGGLDHGPHPRRIDRVEPGLRVEPLAFGHNRAARSVDGLAGVFGGQTVSGVAGRNFRIRFGESAQPEVGAGLESVDHGQRGQVFRCRRIVGQQGLGGVEVLEDELEHLLTRYARVVFQFLHARIFPDDGNGQPLDGFQLGLVGGTFGSLGRQRVVETGQVEVAERAESLGNAHHLLCAFALVCDVDGLIGREDELVIVGVEERGHLAVRCQSGRVARIEPCLPAVVVLVAARQVAADGEHLADHAVGGAEDARVAEVDVLAEVYIVGDEHRRHRSDKTLLCERRFGSLLAGGVSAFGEGLLDTARKKHG